ncbi:MAG: LapA family protein [candidate division Zixibacteria bacterium]|nr:LapA family protein [candidate division Zixibacteria bacterium]
MWAVRSLLTIVLVLCVVAFAYYNSDMDQRVSVNLIWAKYVDVPLITVVFWSFVAGVLVSLFVFVTVFVRQSVQIRGTRRRLQALESEVTVLRNRPIEESADLLKSAENRPAGRASTFSQRD